MIVRGQNLQIWHSLADNMESLGTSFLKTFKVESGHVGSCGPSLQKYVVI